MSQLQDAIMLAAKAHRNAEDPPGEPYILHPMRVMQSLSLGDDAHQNDALRMTAILHDTLERTTVTAAELKRAKFPPAVIAAVKLLTHKKNQTYAAYVLKLKNNPLARAVKIADLLDNADLKHVTFRAGKKKDLRRVVRYAASYKFLTDQITKTEYHKIMKDAE